jgi:hypothetical protein
VLFLKSDNEYIWPHVSLPKRILHFFTFGLFGTSYAKVWNALGDVDVWPFLKEEHYIKAKEEHGYLGK